MSEILKKFKHIWEIDPGFKCPVVGAMLSVEKHKTILKKCGYNVKHMKPYEYHSSIMGCLGDENPVSIKVDNYIRHQAGKSMKEVAGLYEKGDGKGVESLWKKRSEQGLVGPMMYAIAAHGEANAMLLKDVQGEVHMLAHTNMTEVVKVRNQLKCAGEAAVREKDKLAEKSRSVRGMAGVIKTQKLELDRLEKENQELKKQVASLGKLVQPERELIQGHENKLAALEQALLDEKEKVRVAEREKKQGQIELFSAKSENELIRKELDDLVAGFNNIPAKNDCPMASQSNDQACFPDDEKTAGKSLQSSPVSSQDLPCPPAGDCANVGCPQYKLCAKRVFMIGGITKMKSYYRDIVEKAGGDFDYHDGYIKKSHANLAAKVRRCDVVVCPVNCNSHAACLQVKKLCNRYNKELKILSSSSLSAVTQALFVPEVSSAAMN